MKYLLLVTLPVLAIVTWLLFAERRRSASEAEDLSRLRQDMSDLRSRMDGVTAAVPGTQGVSPAEVLNHPEGVRTVNLENVDGAQARPSQAVVTPDEHLQRTAEQFATEPIDLSWSRETEVKIAKGLEAAHIAGATLSKAECASTLCRIELNLQDEIARNRLNELMHIPPFNTKGSLHFEPTDTGIRAIMYIARAGS